VAVVDKQLGVVAGVPVVIHPELRVVVGAGVCIVIVDAVRAVVVACSPSLPAVGGFKDAGWVISVRRLGRRGEESRTTWASHFLGPPRGHHPSPPSREYRPPTSLHKERGSGVRSAIAGALVFGPTSLKGGAPTALIDDVAKWYKPPNLG
jgi:hypothetical protein